MQQRRTIEYEHLAPCPALMVWNNWTSFGQLELWPCTALLPKASPGAQLAAGWRQALRQVAGTPEIGCSLVRACQDKP